MSDAAVRPSSIPLPRVHNRVALSLALLSLVAVRGLALGKWIHNLSGMAMMTAFALLIVAPLWAYAHHLPIHYTPFELHLPKHDFTSLALIGQIIFAAAGLEYIAIMAGESKVPARNIGLSVVIASPIIVLMFTLGTASVLAFHELTMSTILYGPGTETFAVVIMNTQDLGGVGATAALALVLTVPVVAVAALAAALARRTGSSARDPL